jgi:predicted HTH transcriptional regulator
MTIEDIKKLVARGEGPTIEFKSGVPKPEVIAQLISAFANTEGGTVLFGIREPDQIVGLDDTNSLCKSWDRTQKMISGEVQRKLDFIDVSVGKRVGILTVDPSDSIVAANGGYFKRDGDRLRTITAEEIKTHLVRHKPPDAALTDLAVALSQQSWMIEQLREDFQKANSAWKKVLIALGGAAGGTILKVLIEHFFF